MNTVQEILQQELTILLDRIISRHLAANKQVTGKTIAGYQTHTSANSGQLLGYPYALTLDRGRGPAHQAGDTTEFTENLKRWIIAKGIGDNLTPKKLEQLANFLRWYINRYGSNLFRSGQTLDLFETPVQNFIQRLSTRLADESQQTYIRQLFGE